MVISHGSGGSHLAYRTIGAYLAKNGYVVSLPEHPGNNRNNNELNDTVENLVNRPRHVRLTMDAVSSDALLKNGVQPDNAAIIGHSMGGYTALAVAGGTPWSETGQKIEVAYAEGRGVPRNDTRAKQLFRKRCDSGGEESCLRLLHSYGEGWIALPP